MDARAYAEVIDAAGALSDVSVPRSLSGVVSDLAWDVAQYVRHQGDPRIVATLAEASAKTARRLGSAEGNRLADALDRLRASLGEGVAT